MAVWLLLFVSDDVDSNHDDCADDDNGVGDGDHGINDNGDGDGDDGDMVTVMVVDCLLYF